MDKTSTYAVINLENLKNNFNIIKNKVGDKLVIPIIKADAYGHGAVDCARVLEEEGAKYFAVSSLYEAIQLRKNGIYTDILVLGYIPVEYIKDVIRYNITTTIYSVEYASKLNELCKINNVVSKVHIKMNTGMNRLGFSGADNVLFAAKEISNMSNLILEGLFSHFATSDEEDKEFSKAQFAEYIEAVNILERNGINIPIKHIANSAAVTDLPDVYLDAVRPGLILYGVSPSAVKNEYGFKPVMSLYSVVADIRHVPKNNSISYGRKYYTSENETIITVPIGYADGYHRTLTNKGEILINNNVVGRVVGSVCMDMTMFKVPKDSAIKVGDKVEIFGENISVVDVAEKAGTIPYEILCHINKRVLREYEK